MDMLEIDGAAGGGQLLRSALALSLCTGTPFTMANIRAGRPRPGLMRQHLAGVTAATQIGRGRVHGAELGATTLRFEPGDPVAGDYHYVLGSAGSTLLVLQTVLPALLRTSAPSTLRLEGGTHNPLAPCADFIAETFLPALARLGVRASLELERHGFYPAGGGSVSVRVEPAPILARASMMARGERRAVRARALLSALPANIAQRELEVLARILGLAPEQLSVETVRPALGPGNAVLLRVEHADHIEVFTGYGEKGVSAERVAERLAHEVAIYLQSEACVGEHLADQLLLPMALAGGGEFTTTTISEHLRSNAALIEKFVEVEIAWTQLGEHAWHVTIAS
jgi:RNA 3'-terminal phosphate cyclase (ATP)